jgi:hypothetical protein
MLAMERQGYHCMDMEMKTFGWMPGAVGRAFSSEWADDSTPLCGCLLNGSADGALSRERSERSCRCVGVVFSWAYGSIS